MPFRSFLLRVLLCLSLALNGVATAAVSVRMQEASSVPPAMQVAESAQAVAGEVPCHGHGDDALAPDGTEVDGTKPHPAGHAGSDCCDSGFCRCACMHAAQATLPVALPAMGIATHDLGVRVLQPGHAAPALPHLIRPPIG